MKEIPTNCRTIQIATNEYVLGHCGRELKNGYCPIHGHYSTAPSRWMVSSVLDEEPEKVIVVTSSTKRKLLTVGKVIMASAVGMLFVFPTAIGLFWMAIGFQWWITIKCWVR